MLCNILSSWTPPSCCFNASIVIWVWRSEFSCRDRLKTAGVKSAGSTWRLKLATVMANVPTKRIVYLHPNRDWRFQPHTRGWLVQSRWGLIHDGSLVSGRQEHDVVHNGAQKDRTLDTYVVYRLCEQIVNDDSLKFFLNKSRSHMYWWIVHTYRRLNNYPKHRVTSSQRWVTSEGEFQWLFISNSRWGRLFIAIADSCVSSHACGRVF